MFVYYVEKRKLATCETIRSQTLSLNSNSILTYQVANQTVNNDWHTEEEVLALKHSPLPPEVKLSSDDS